MEVGHMAPGHAGARPETGVHGERPVVPERVIVAPANGRFHPLPPEEPEGDGGADAAEIVEEQVIGFVETNGQQTPVRSPFRGVLMGTLAHAGERVREGQPVAWLRLV